MNEELLQQMYDHNKAMGEAGGIAFCELWGVSTDEDGVKHHVRINVTARDLNSTSALRQLMETIKFAKEEYKMKPYQPNFGSVSKPKTEPVGNSDPFPAVQEAAKPAVQTNPATNRPVPAEGVNAFHCTRLVVSQYNGKAKLDFYSAGRKYAELTSYVAPEQAGAWFQPFGLTSDDFFGSGEHTVSLKVLWKNSDKLNSKGNPYKNVVSIEAA